jgi:hypothetical protein
MFLQRRRWLKSRKRGRMMKAWQEKAKPREDRKDA